MSKGLEPLSPGEAVELYIDHREPEVSEKTLRNHRYRLDTFIEFCERYDIETLDELSARDLHRYQMWRRQDGEVSTITLRSNLATIRVFLEFCADINAVEPGMRERVKLPDVSRDEEARDEKLDVDLAQSVLDHLDRYEFASRDHVVVGILWHTGIRLGSLRALDIGDFDADDQCLDLRHRPESDTPLKNGAAAERSIAVGDYYCEVISEYIAVNRPAVTDEYGREPLIVSEYGRLSSAPIRDTVYQWTRPCVLGQECPHDRVPEECEAMRSGQASMCPSSRSPHEVRRGAITEHLRSGTPERVVSDRMNVSDEVLEKHYDRRTEREKMELRRDYIPEV